jgi:hypothetical protein
MHSVVTWTRGGIFESRQEREIAEQAERAYAVLTAQWQPQRPAGKPRLPAIPGAGDEAVTWAA